MRIRPMRREDLRAVTRIEKALTGKRAGTLEKDVARILRQGDPRGCLVAEEDGGVVGFIVGDVRPWEFGETSEVGWIRAIGVEVINTAAAAQTDIADFFSIIQRGVARLFIGNKDYSEWPIYLLPSSGGVAGMRFTNTAATLGLVLSNGVPDVRNSYTLSRPLLIPRQLNFRIRLEWPGATAVTSNFDVRVVLKGEISRQIQ